GDKSLGSRMTFGIINNLQCNVRCMLRNKGIDHSARRIGIAKMIQADFENNAWSRFTLQRSYPSTREAELIRPGPKPPLVGTLECRRYQARGCQESRK